LSENCCDTAATKICAGTERRAVQYSKQTSLSRPYTPLHQTPTACRKFTRHSLRGNSLHDKSCRARHAILASKDTAPRGRGRRVDASASMQGSSFRGIPAGIPRFWDYRAGSVAKPVGIPLPNRTCYPIGIPVGLTGTGPVFSVKKINRLDARSRASASRKPATNQHNTAALSRSRSRRPGAAREPSHSIPSLRRHARDPHKFPPPTALSPLPEFIASPSLWPVASYCG
jgi:hypothetical protein